ncbi:hypothetical protein B0H14DRAFT_3466253 [Mycena olivaceomarginata]|nr:hypothetical protein B0H14DRAFT_3466253 [Mycena olivaceomarginata]
MSSSPPSTPTRSEDPLSNVFSAMVQESLVAPSPTTSQKRTRDDIDPGSDKEGNSSIPAFTVPNPNTVQAVQRFAERKRLHAEEITELNVFIKDPAPVHDAKLLVHLLHVSNQLDGIVTAVLLYAVSLDLEQISLYKGTVPTNTLLAIVKARRFDLPPGIETNTTDFRKVIAVGQEAFTQLHAKFKKSRQVYLQEDGPKFWDKLHSTLAGICAKASGDAKMIARAFRHILEKDQDLHGVKADYSIVDSAVEILQQEVNDIIDTNTLNTATSGAALIAYLKSAEHTGLAELLKTSPLDQLSSSRTWGHAGPICDVGWKPGLYRVAPSLYRHVVDISAPPGANFQQFHGSTEDHHCKIFVCIWPGAALHQPHDKLLWMLKKSEEACTK